MQRSKRKETIFIEFIKENRDNKKEKIRKRSTKMSFWISIIIVIAIVIYFIVMLILQKRAVTILTQDEFIEGYRKAQLIDLREREVYQTGHILGARNLPMSQLNMRIKELRKDKPIYLYCANGIRSGRAALTLKKKGYKDIYMLSGGFKNWSGKIKK